MIATGVATATVIGEVGARFRHERGQTNTPKNPPQFHQTKTAKPPRKRHGKRATG